MTQQELFTNSWGLNSGFEKLNEALSELVPLQGKCDFHVLRTKIWNALGLHQI